MSEYQSLLGMWLGIATAALLGACWHTRLMYRADRWVRYVLAHPGSATLDEYQALVVRRRCHGYRAVIKTLLTAFALFIYFALRRTPVEDLIIDWQSWVAAGLFAAVVWMLTFWSVQDWRTSQHWDYE